MLAQFIPYIWIAIIICAAVVELLTLTLVSVWFIPGAVITFIMSLFSIQTWVQVLVFVIISSVMLILSRTIFKKFIKFRSEPTNSESLIGKTAIVTEEINNMSGLGAVRINGLEWSAKSEQNDVIYEKGIIVTVEKIEGVKLICSR